MQWRILIVTAALGACAQRPHDLPPASLEATLAPRYPSWSEVATPPVHEDRQVPSVVWRIDSPPESEPLGGGASVETVAVSGHGHSVNLEVILFDSRSVTLAVLDQPYDGFGGGRLTGCMRSANAIAGVNGGFFTPEFTPMGLMIAGGRRLGGWQPNKLLTGAVAVRHGHPRLWWNDEVRDASKEESFVQAGPRLVDDGIPVTGLERHKQVPRTFIATDGSHRWAFGLARNTSLAELAEILSTPGVLNGLQVKRALNLDGGRSSALYYRTSEGQEHAQPGWSAVRNYLAILPR